MEKALNAIQTEQFVHNTNIIDNAMLIGYVGVKEGTTDLSNPAHATFVHVGKFSSTSGVSGTFSLQSSYDVSDTTEITTNATNGAFTVQRGSASDADIVLATNNGAGAPRLTINGNGLITTQDSAIITGTLTATGLAYPTSDGGANQVLTTNGSATLGWSDVVATELATSGAPISIDSTAPPGADYILVSTSTITATWQERPAAPKTNFTLASTELLATAPTYESVSFFAWDDSAYSSLSGGTLTMWINTTDLNIDIRLRDLTNNANLGEVLAPAPGIIVVALTNPPGDASIALQVRHSGAGTTHPQILGASLTYV
jgi:hypothetical protein